MATPVQIKYYTSNGKLIKRLDYNYQLFQWLRTLKAKGCKRAWVKLANGLEKCFILND